MIAQVIAPLCPDEKAWATFQARAALAGHTATKDVAGWIVVSRWGTTLSFASMVEAEIWLGYVIGGAA